MRRKQFSLEQKLKILEKIDSGEAKHSVAKEFNIAPSTLSTFIKDRHKIENQIRDGAIGPKRKKIRAAKFEDVDNAVFKWFQEVRSRNIPINGPLIREKALEFSKLFGHDNFQASVGWLNRFRERFGISFKIICGEEKSVPLDKVNEWRAGEIQTILKTYDKRDIFNADETGVFYQLLPNKTLTLQGDSCKGGTKSKQRLTALFCCNATGTEKLKPLVIGKSLKPRCFKNIRSLPCEYRANKRAWMTQIIFNEWLVELDKKMRKNKRKILLLIDNCSAHNLNCQLTNVNVKYFPPHCTAVLQPLDLGIIQAVKINFRKKLVQKLLLNLLSDTKINVKEGCELLTAAWWDVRESTILKCFLKTQLFESEADFIETEFIEGESEQNDVNPELEDLWKLVDAPGITFQDYVDVDNHLLISHELTNDEIMKSVKDVSNSVGLTLESGDSDSDATEEPINKTKMCFSTALDCLTDVKFYLSTVNNAPEEAFQNIQAIENFIMKTATKNMLQSKLTDFFTQ